MSDGLSKQVDSAFRVISLTGFIVSIAIFIVSFFDLSYFDLLLDTGMIVGISGGIIHRPVYRYLLKNYYEYENWRWESNKAKTRAEKRRRIRIGLKLWKPANLQIAMPFMPKFIYWLTYPFWIVSAIYFILASTLSTSGVVKVAAPFWLLNSLSLFVSAIHLTNLIVLSSKIRGSRRAVG